MYVALCEMYNFVNWKNSNNIEGGQMGEKKKKTYAKLIIITM